jgi:hypothetical protein
MPTDYPFDAVLLQFSGDTNTVIARQRFRTVNGVPLSPTWWTTKDAEGNPLAVYEAEVVDEPNPRDGDETVYYRALSYRVLYGPGGALGTDRSSHGSAVDELPIRVMLARTDSPDSYVMREAMTVQGRAPEHLNVLNDARTHVEIYDLTGSANAEPTTYRYSGASLFYDEATDNGATQIDIPIQKG